MHLQKEKLMNAIKTLKYQTKIKTSDKVKYSGRVFTTTVESKSSASPKKMNILQSCSHKPGGGPFLSITTAKTSKGPVNDVNGQMDDFCTRKLYC